MLSGFIHQNRLRATSDLMTNLSFQIIKLRKSNVIHCVHVVVVHVVVRPHILVGQVEQYVIVYTCTLF